MASLTSMRKSTSDLDNHDSGASSGGSSVYPIAPDWMFNTYTVPEGHEISLPITKDTDIYPSSDDSRDFSRLHLVDLAMLQSEQQIARTIPARGEQLSQPHVQLLQQQERLLRLLEEDMRDQRDSTRRIQEMQQLQGQLLELHTQQISDLNAEFREFRLNAGKGHPTSSCSCNSASSSSSSTSPTNYSRSHRGQVPHPYSPAHDSFCSQHPAMMQNHRNSLESRKQSRRPVPADIDMAVQEATRVLQSFFSDGGLGVQRNAHQKDCRKSRRENSERQSRMVRSSSQKRSGERKSRSDTHLDSGAQRPEERRRAQSVGDQRRESSRRRSVDKSRDSRGHHSKDSKGHRSKDHNDRKARHMEHTVWQRAANDRRSSKRYGVASSIDMDLNNKQKTHTQHEKTQQSVHIEDMAIVEAPISSEKPSEKTTKKEKSSKSSSNVIYKKKKTVTKGCSIM